MRSLLLSQTLIFSGKKLAYQTHCWCLQCDRVLAKVSKGEIAGGGRLPVPWIRNRIWWRSKVKDEIFGAISSLSFDLSLYCLSIALLFPDRRRYREGKFSLSNCRTLGVNFWQHISAASASAVAPPSSEWPLYCVKNNIKNNLCGSSGRQSCRNYGCMHLCVQVRKGPPGFSGLKVRTCNKDIFLQRASVNATKTFSCSQLGSYLFCPPAIKQFVGLRDRAQTRIFSLLCTVCTCVDGAGACHVRGSH